MHTLLNITVFSRFRLRWHAKNRQFFQTLIIFLLGLLPQVTILFITTRSHVWRIKLSYFLKAREKNERISSFWFDMAVLRRRLHRATPVNKQHQGLAKDFPFCGAVLCSITQCERRDLSFLIKTVTGNLLSWKEFRVTWTGLAVKLRKY